MSDTSNPLSLDTNQLAQRYFDLQQATGEDPGWSDKNHQALYFISAGSEYRLWMPTVGKGFGLLPQATITTYGKILDQLQDWVDANLSGSQQSDQLARIAAARAELDGNSEYPTLTITTTVDHIRGAAEDDHAAIAIMVFWSQALNMWLPADIQLGFTWATATVPVPNSLMQDLLEPLPSPYITLIRSALKRIPVIGWAVQLVSIVRYTTEAWNFAVTAISKMADDGGRLYFPTVVSETVTRILQSITPAIATDVAAMSTPDLMRLGRTWTAEYEQSLYNPGSYRYFDSEMTTTITWTAGGQTTGYYSVTLPDLVYVLGGNATLLSFKMTTQDESCFAALTLLFAADGDVLMASGVVQFSNGSIYSSPPVWASSEQDLNAMFWQMTDALFGDNVPSVGDTSGEEGAMQNVLVQYLDSLAASTRSIAPSSSTLLGALPPLPAVSFGSAVSIASGMQRPAVAVASSGYGVVVCVDTSGEDALWETTISTSATSMSVSSAQSSSYQGGQDPALAMWGSSDVLEVHGGNGNNSLYYNLMTLSGSSVSIPDDGDKYEKGENPALAVVGSTAYELHRDQSSGNDTLYYELGTISSSSVKWSGSETEYAKGDNAFACAVPGHSNLVVAHVRDDTIYTMNAAVSSSSISFGDEQTLGDGDGPAVAVLGSGWVIVFHQGTDDASNTLCTSIGLWSSASIQWIVTGVHAFTGGYPGASRRSDDTVAVVYENNNGSGGIAGRMASLSLPAGFV